MRNINSKNFVSVILKNFPPGNDIVREIFEQADNRTITLLFAATDHLHNQAIVLQDF